MKPKKRILSGIQPSDANYIGNYFGPIETWVRLMEDIIEALKAGRERARVFAKETVCGAKKLMGLIPDF